MKRKITILPLIAILGLYLLSMTASPPNNIGVNNGRLAELPDSPNAVSTQTEKTDQAMKPLEMTRSAKDSINKIAELIREMPRTHITKQTDDYLHAEFTSLIFRFVDDVEFLADEKEGVIHFRSASRVGHSDLGANKKRMDKITAAWSRQP